MISLAELQRRIDSGDLSAATAISQSCEANRRCMDKTIGAFVCRPKNVRAASTGPLRGIAVGIKDIIDTSDLPTEMGSAIYKGWQPRADAPVVAMLKQAGATISARPPRRPSRRTIRRRRSIRTITITRRADRHRARRRRSRPA